MGNLGLKLKPFGVDRLLGLRPFATASLGSTALYVGLVTLTFVPQVVFSVASLTPLILTFAFLLLGLVFFVAPLISLRANLVRAKRDAAKWVGSWYTRNMEQMMARGDGPMEERLVNELVAIDKVQRDIQRMSTWPFDTGIVVRLTAIILTVVGIILARVITVALSL
jgi:hypothetical protein